MPLTPLNLFPSRVLVLFVLSSQILPDIIQGCKIPDDGGKKKKKIFKAKSSNNVGRVGELNAPVCWHSMHRCTIRGPAYPKDGFVVSF